MIVATAGHIDHGKTSLIRRLTGVDTDRLPEERQRGLTIDLGFAYMTLPDHGMIGFVDVPGHERFLRNMLAGVLGVETVLLIVAADDGPMPQTREHLTILALIGVRHVTAVITKIDRVDAERVLAVTREVDDLLTAAAFVACPILPVSSHTGAGIPALLRRLAEMRASQVVSRAGAAFRMPIDRCFSLSGVGTVATGTVLAGSVAVGDLLLLTPRGVQVRVRGVRAYDREAREARQGERCALAISGSRLDRAAVERGDWLVAPPLHAPTSRFEACVRCCGEADLRSGLPVHVHVGTADITGRLTLLGPAHAHSDEQQFAQLTLDRTTAVLHGDRVIIRDHAAKLTLAGGRIVDPSPPTRRRPRAERLRLLRGLEIADPQAAAGAILLSEGYLDLARFAHVRNLPPAEMILPAARRVGRAGAQVLISAKAEAAVRGGIIAAFDRWHAERPDSAGPSKATLLQALRAVATPPVLEAVIGDLVAAGVIIRGAATLHRAGHTPRLSSADEALWAALAPALREAGLRPPRLRELAERFSMTPAQMEQALIRLEAFGRLLRLAPNRFFLIETLIALGATAGDLTETAEEGGFPAAAFAQATGIGRNLTIEVLEYLDRIGVTRRTGELRHIVRPVEEALT